MDTTVCNEIDDNKKFAMKKFVLIKITHHIFEIKKGWFKIKGSVLS